MKRFLIRTCFTPLKWDKETGEFDNIKNSSGKIIEFKTRAAVEKYCLKNGCIYVESKFIFYR